MENDDLAQLQAMDWAIRMKTEGNEAFKVGKYDEAINKYTQAIELDPDNHALYSNRSASYLKKGFYGTALDDAEMCIKCKGDWPKGYGRKGDALFALKRYKDALKSYQEGLDLDPENALLQESFQTAENAKLEAELQKMNDDLQKENKKKEEEAKKKKDDDDLLAMFDAEVNAAERKADPNSVKTTKTTQLEWKLGDPSQQVDRIVQNNYKWINLNPFTVLQLPIECTGDDIKVRYRKLSAAVHPDKCKHEKAREAFEEVKKAHSALADEEKRIHLTELIKGCAKQTKKDRKRLLKKGVVASALGTEEEHIKKETMKMFALIEHRRVTAEKHQRTHDQREKDNEQKEIDKHRKIAEDTLKMQENRQERCDGWRKFVGEEPAAKRRRFAVASMAEDAQKYQHRKIKERKFTGIQDQYKRNWK
eukprot:TRINITY_DN775821_c0_g1_i1.p1 TRINITY_DN775821_c0_g1~~TRINITY_DN775821_c0_g1_i1.p1  ORF type:complete len:421 (-),score=155.05 TRINITY_DN775821_c0_g1_i1:145-1407(-)